MPSVAAPEAPQADTGDGDKREGKGDGEAQEDKASDDDETSSDSSACKGRRGSASSTKARAKAKAAVAKAKAQSKAAVLKAKESAAKAKAETAALKDRFRKYRQRNPDSALAREHREASSRGKVNQEQLTELLAAYERDVVFAKRACEQVQRGTKSATLQEHHAKETEANFAETCARLQLDPWSPETSDRLEAMAKLGYARGLT
ncbi:MAG: hypothetical protein GY772_19915 [bacterium]|nr:hypothetical protein [bacterium]